MKKSICLLLAAVMLSACIVSMFCFTSFATDGPGYLTDEVSRTSEEIVLRNGTHTGVTWTQITLGGHYGNKLVNVAEFNLTDTHLSIEVINHGNYMTNASTVAEAVRAYNRKTDGQTVVAAINGDLYMTKVHSGESVAKKVLNVPRGVMIVDHEIWASQQTDQENLGATNAEKGTPAGNKLAFGVTDANQPIIGSPDIKTVVKNLTKKTEVKPNGINRVPAMNALMIYNNRMCDSTYALSDSYEVEIEVDETSSFTLTNDITGTVKGIYKNGTTERAGLGEKTVILTARGTRIKDLQGFAVGDKVSVSTSLEDRFGNTELWYQVEDAMGGHMHTLRNGIETGYLGNTEYPAALIGYKADGTVMFTTVTAQVDKKYIGLNFAQAAEFCKELGYNDVFYLDGGGSTTMVTVDSGKYVLRNKCSDGSERSVISSIAVVWNEEPVCKVRGSYKYIDSPVDLSKYKPYYMDGALLSDAVSNPNAVKATYNSEQKSMDLKLLANTTDPRVTLDMTQFWMLKAQECKYIVLKVKPNISEATDFALYYATGSRKAIDNTHKVTVNVPADTGDWQYITVDMSGEKDWSNTINILRLDIFEGRSSKKNEIYSIGGIALCKDLTEAENVSKGILPDGSVADYLEYKDSLKPEDLTAPEETTTEEITTEEPTTEAETTYETKEETTPEEVTSVETTIEQATTEAAATAEVTSGESVTAAEKSNGGCGGIITVSFIPFLMASTAIMIKRKE